MSVDRHNMKPGRLRVRHVIVDWTLRCAPENAAWNDNRIQRCPHPTSLRKPRLCALGDDSRITSVYWMGATFLSERRRLCQQRETLTASGASARDGSKHHRVPASPRPHWLRSRLTARGDSFDLCARSASGTRFRKRRSYCGTVPRFRPASSLCSIRPERNSHRKSCRSGGGVLTWCWRVSCSGLIYRCWQLFCRRANRCLPETLASFACGLSVARENVAGTRVSSCSHPFFLCGRLSRTPVE